MRLPRPAIPLKTKCLVALRQVGEIWPEAVIAAHHGKLRAFLATILDNLADLLGCEAKELHLDHDPALGAREKIRDRAGRIIRYLPDANDPEHLHYRWNVAHRIKTNVRGEHGQHPDRVLIKKMRRFENPERFAKANKREFGKLRRLQNKKGGFKPRKLRSASRWPPKGSRKIRNRPWAKTRKSNGRPTPSTLG